MRFLREVYERSRDIEFTVVRFLVQGRSMNVVETLISLSRVNKLKI